MHEDMTDLLDVAMRLVDLMPDSDRALLVSYCAQMPVQATQPEDVVHGLTTIGYDLDRHVMELERRALPGAPVEPHSERDQGQRR